MVGPNVVQSLAGIFNLAETMDGIPSLQRNAQYIRFSLLKFLKFMFNIIEFNSSAFYLLLNTNKERQVSTRN
jgi:hypothetical protein